MEWLQIGVVSNVWGAYLATTELSDLCRRAKEAGFRYVEIRQGAAGECEDPAFAPPLPLPDRLAALRERHPALGFNLAVEVPFLSPAEPLNDELIERALAGAKSVGRADPPFLRLVDTRPAARVLDPEEFAAAADRTVGLVHRAAENGVRIALENSRQPVSLLEELRAIAGDQTDGEQWRPRLCWDPANMLASLAPESPGEFAARVPIAELAEFHFKQLRDGTTEDEVGPGRIDWRDLLQTLRVRAYHGPALFEIPAGDDAWQRLSRSHRYIRGLLTDLE